MVKNENDNFRYFIWGIIILVLIVTFFVINFNRTSLLTCSEVQTPYEEQEEYLEYGPPQNLSQKFEQKEQIVYNSTLQASAAGEKMFAFFSIRSNSILKCTISTSKLSYFGITTPEECDKLLKNKPYKPGYVARNNVTFSVINENTSTWVGSPTSLCLYILDYEKKSSNLNRAKINLTNYWIEDTLGYEPNQELIKKYRMVIKYKNETICGRNT